jgi:hypothetical protein
MLGLDGAYKSDERNAPGPVRDSMAVEFQPVRVDLTDRGLVFRSLEAADLEALEAFYKREGFSEVGRTPAIIDMMRCQESSTPGCEVPV